MRMRWLWMAMLLVVLVAGGCTRESVRVALEAQRRANDVQQAVFDRQHDALCLLLYRDLLGQVQAVAPLDEAQRTVLRQRWQDRDLVEWWRVQHERARALRIAGVDAKLASDQSMVDLLLRALLMQAERLQEGLAAAAGAGLPTDAEGDAHTDAQPEHEDEP